METHSYRVTVKTEYAAAILEELLEKEAIEMIPDEIPDLQKKESLRRLKLMNEQPETNLTPEQFFNSVADDFE